MQKEPVRGTKRLKFKKCCVKNCDSSELNSPKERFFNFPVNHTGKRFLKWVAFAQNPELSIAKSYSRASICGKHFATDMFTGENRQRLLRYSLPTLYPPDKAEPSLPDHVYSLDLPVCSLSTPPPPSPPPPSPPPPAEEEVVEVDSTLVEVLDEDQATERINKLMAENDTLMEQNIILKKENTKLRIGNDYYKGELARWQSCAHSLVAKATQNSCEEFLYHAQEISSLKTRLAGMSAELEALKKEKTRLQDEVDLFISLPTTEEDDASAMVVCELNGYSKSDQQLSLPTSQLNVKQKPIQEEDVEELFEVDDISADWVVEDEVEL